MCMDQSLIIPIPLLNALVFITCSVKVIAIISSRKFLCTYSLSLSLLEMLHKFHFFRPFSGVFIFSSDELEEGKYSESFLLF